MAVVALPQQTPAFAHQAVDDQLSIFHKLHALVCKHVPAGVVSTEKKGSTLKAFSNNPHVPALR